MIANNSFREGRIQSERELAREAMDNEELVDSGILFLGPTAAKGVENIELWELKFAGRKDSDLYPGVYTINITFPADYPYKWPRFFFPREPRQFEHMHVWKDTKNGDVCVGPLGDSGWQPKFTMIQISEMIVAMLHSPPKPYDAANKELREVFEKNPATYYEKLRIQAQLFKPK